MGKSRWQASTPAPPSVSPTLPVSCQNVNRIRYLNSLEPPQKGLPDGAPSHAFFQVRCGACRLRQIHEHLANHRIQAIYLHGPSNVDMGPTKRRLDLASLRLDAFDK